jgi:pimeloyl-ACP methyl ester carboxylesterase
VLYEPPRFDSVTPEVRARLHACLESGDLDGLLATFLIDVVEATLQPDLQPEARQQMLGGMRRWPVWSAALRNARSIPAEVDSYASYRFDAAEFREFTAPTVLLVGASSSAVIRRWVVELAAALPVSRVLQLEGQAHGAMWAAPDEFAATVDEALDWATVP